MRILISFLTIMLVSNAVHAGAGADRLDRFMRDVNTLKANFAQTLFDENMAKIEDSAGRFVLSRPGRFRWDYTQPYPQEIVGDGHNVWFYDSELAQVTVKSLDKAVGGTPAALLSSQSDLHASFAVRDLGEQSGLAWVELTPKATDESFTSLRLGFGGDGLRMMEMADNLGQITQLKFSDVAINPALEDSLFKFSPPPGADVIGKPQ